MRLNNLKTFGLVLLAGVLVLSACVPATPVVPTIDANAVKSTVEAAQTQAVQKAWADLTSTAIANPTATIEPTQVQTNTSMPTATAMNTLVPVLPTRVIVTLAPTKILPTSTPSAYSCSITASSPAANKIMPPGNDFDGRWTLKNTGTKTWSSSQMDFAYVSGTKLQKLHDVIDLPSDVAPGASIELIIDMKAPTTIGSYAATWSLRINSTNICPVSVSIRVQ